MGSRLEGRVAVVTGAGRGIGRSVALLLAEEGASVVVNDLGGSVDGAGQSSGPALEVVDEIKSSGGQALASFDSVAEFEGAQQVVRTALAGFGRVDILCHAAGILRDRMVFNMTEEEWDGVLRVHLVGAFNMVRSAVPHMMEQRYGRVVLFSSISALGAAGQANYAAAKEGMVGLARSLAAELGPHGITANAVYPGANTRMMATVTNTPASSADRPRPGALGGASAVGADALLSSPEPPEAQLPESNAAKIVYLCTESAGAVTGQVVSTNGWSMGLYSRRHAMRSIHKDGRWTLDELERLVPISLTAGLDNPAAPEALRGS